MEGHGVVGFRFHPTEEEIITYFLERKLCGLDFPVHTIEDVVDVCMYEPWDLPQLSPMPKEDRVWYFFNAPVSKYANSKRINRTTNSGFWKCTGKDRVIWDKQGKKIGFKKNLVFHKGRVPNGIRTNWVIHEYHSDNAFLYPKEYVLSRLKRKSGDKPDASSEPSPHHLVFDSGNYATENTNPQTNRDLSEELRLLLDHNTLPAILSMVNSNGFDHISPPSLLSMVQPAQGTSYSDGFNNEPSSLNYSGLETSEQEEAFVNSLLADQGEFSGERSMNTLHHDFNPTIPLSRRYVQDSSDADSKIYEQHGKVQGTSNLFDENAHVQLGTGWALGGTFSSSEGDGIMDWDTSSIGSDTDLPGSFCLQSVVDELQHTPKHHKYFKAQCSTQELQTQRKVSNKAVSKVEMGEAVHHAVDLRRTENSTVRLVKDKQMAQTTSASKNSNSSSNGSTSSNTKESYIFSLTAASGSDGAVSSNKKSSFISLETPQLSHKTNPPSVYLFNVLVSLVLIIFIIREMAYLH